MSKVFITLYCGKACSTRYKPCLLSGEILLRLVVLKIYSTTNSITTNKTRIEKSFFALVIIKIELALRDYTIHRYYL